MAFQQTFQKEKDDEIQVAAPNHPKPEPCLQTFVADLRDLRLHTAPDRQA